MTHTDTAAKCAICNRAKGKRGCRVRSARLICSRCCGENRGAECDGCGYYRAGNRYQAAKKGSLKARDFIIELNEEVDGAVERALEAVERGRFPKAKRILDRLIEDHPRNHMVLYGMGLYYALQDKCDEAIIYLKDAVEVFPIFLEAHFNLMVAYKNVYDTANMIRSARRVCELSDPGSEFHEQAQDLIATTERLFEENDGFGLEAFMNGQDEFDRAFRLMGESEWKGALKGFERAVRWYPALAQPYGNMGICYAKTGEKKRAIEAFDKALEIDPDYEPALVNRKAAEALAEGQCLPEEVKPIRYFRRN